jgi:monofunctional biosynthetic peptidoglycan transglycosylase
MTSAAIPRKSAFRMIRWLVVAVLILILLPYLIAPLYRVINPVSTLMVGRWILGKRVERTWVSIDRVAPVLPRTVIASEDARFCTHHGADMTEMRAALEDADDITDVRGGSTLTQQLAKNLFLWPGRSIVRKALEFPLALWVDLVLPKRRIMEIYLNIAEWGPDGEFGIEAGTRKAFGRSSRELSAPEAGLMAAILPNPKRRSAMQPRPGVRRIAGIVQARAARVRSIDACLRG